MPAGPIGPIAPLAPFRAARAAGAIFASVTDLLFSCVVPTDLAGSSVARIRHPAQGDEQGEQRRDVRERQAATDSEEHDLSSLGSEPVSGAEGSYERPLEARSPLIVCLPPEASS